MLATLRSPQWIGGWGRPAALKWQLAGARGVTLHEARGPATEDRFCLTTSCMVSRGRSLTRSGPVRSRGGAGRKSSRRVGKLIRAWGSFLAGDQPGGGAQHGVGVVASAEVPGQGPPVLQVADAVLDADPLGRVSSAFGLVCRGEGGWDRQLVLPPGRPRSDDRTSGLGA